MVDGRGCQAQFDLVGDALFVVHRRKRNHDSRFEVGGFGGPRGRPIVHHRYLNRHFGADVDDPFWRARRKKRRGREFHLVRNGKRGDVPDRQGLNRAGMRRHRKNRAVGIDPRRRHKYREGHQQQSFSLFPFEKRRLYLVPQPCDRTSNT